MFPSVSFRNLINRHDVTKPTAPLHASARAHKYLRRDVYDTAPRGAAPVPRCTTLGRVFFSAGRIRLTRGVRAGLDPVAGVGISRDADPG